MLEWKVLNSDFNKDKIIEYNVFNKELENDIKKAVKDKMILNYAELKSYIQKKFRYQYWSRAEYEILVSGLFSKNTEKIDIYRQLEINLDRITEYVNNTLELNFKNKGDE